MKYLMTLAALFVSSLAMAQLPYNPDSDNDQLIDFDDLASLLAFYGVEWNPDSINVYLWSECPTPDFCGTNCGSDRELPGDADVFIRDGGGSSGNLFIAGNPRPLLILGVDNTPELAFNVNVDKHYIQYIQANSRKATLLFSFNGEWWHLK